MAPLGIAGGRDGAPGALTRSAGPGREWPGLGLPSPQLWPRAPCPGAEATLPCLPWDRARGHALSLGRGSWRPGPGLCSSNHLGDGSREAFSTGSEVCTELLNLYLCSYSNRGDNRKIIPVIGVRAANWGVFIRLLITTHYCVTFLL